MLKRLFAMLRTKGDPNAGLADDSALAKTRKRLQSKYHCADIIFAALEEACSREDLLDALVVSKRQETFRNRAPGDVNERLVAAAERYHREVLSRESTDNLLDLALLAIERNNDLSDPSLTAVQLDPAGEFVLDLGSADPVREPRADDDLPIVESHDDPLPRSTPPARDPLGIDETFDMDAEVRAFLQQARTLR